MIRLSLDWSEYDSWRVEFYKYRSTSSPRFGQAFCNKFLPAGMSWPLVYYEEDDGRAFEFICRSLEFTCPEES